MSLFLVNIKYYILIIIIINSVLAFYRLYLLASIRY